MYRRSAAALVAFLAIATLSCGGGNPVKVGDAVPTVLKGFVVKGPVKAATVRVFKTGDDLALE